MIIYSTAGIPEAKAIRDQGPSANRHYELFRAGARLRLRLVPRPSEKSSVQYSPRPGSVTSRLCCRKILYRERRCLMDP
jgi:hypothetical protein